MAKEKITIIFIVEGSSDKAALENIFKKIYRRNKEIDFGFTNGDITSDPTVTIANVENRIYETVQDNMGASWRYIKEGLHSLERHTNLHIYFKTHPNSDGLL